MCPLSDDPEFKTVQGPRHYSAARIAILAVAVSFILFGEEVVSASAGARERGMWVWEAKQILASATKTDEFLDFCRRNGIVDIYLALESNPSLDAKQFQIATPQLYHVFLARAHANGVRVEVLIGAPEWAAAKYHPRAMSAVEAVLKFNRQAPGRSCFDGVHLDIEPYVLVGFADLDYRQQLLGEFLDLIAECVARVRTDPHLLLTVDVPWWFYPVLSHERIQLSVSFAGGVKTIGEHLSDLLNTVTLMDYRNRAGGANGIVACATPALTYAARQHKRVVIGLETFQQPGRPFYFAFRLDAASFRNQMRAAGLLGELTFHGYVMAAVADGERIYLGLGISSGPSTGPREPVEAALAKLAALLRAGSVPDGFAISETAAAPPGALAENPEFENPRVFTWTDPATGRRHSGYQLDSRTAPSVTFHGQGRSAFDEETQSAARIFNQYPSFAGMAIHSYEGLVSLAGTQ